MNFISEASILKESTKGFLQRIVSVNEKPAKIYGFCKLCGYQGEFQLSRLKRHVLRQHNHDATMSDYLKFNETPTECIYENWNEFIENPSVNELKLKENIKFKKFKRSLEYQAEQNKRSDFLFELDKKIDDIEQNINPHFNSKSLQNILIENKNKKLVRKISQKKEPQSLKYLKNKVYKLNKEIEDYKLYKVKYNTVKAKQVIEKQKLDEQILENQKLKEQLHQIDQERQDRGIEIFRLKQEKDELEKENSKLKQEFNIKVNKKSNFNKENQEIDGIKINENHAVKKQSLCEFIEQSNKYVEEKSILIDITQKQNIDNIQDQTYKAQASFIANS